MEITDEYPPVTKDNLIEGTLKLLFAGAISTELAISEIKKYALDTRLEWK